MTSTCEDNAQKTQAMYDKFEFGAKGVKEVDAKTLHEWISEAEPGSLAIVDVRLPAEREVSMIPGAITKEDFEAGIAGAGASRVVVYCTIGKRSGDYVMALDAKQVPFDAYNLAGSILAWTHAGLPLEKDGEPTVRVHTYGEAWAIAADGYQAEYF
eukprot:TRINITY_DN15829_c0_g1_i1.p1 TRINITY_DN15829_c0_g1~~TRINITY_DN15829_c0_g1_i1.p1  ORF type:complete len:156 (-),score=27.36 TRINITY_DN15829_c0_g1_i1:99-566(-)